nr:PREDICTED: cytochrome b561 and DOMON domain-containing protein At5g35735-like [Nicotiana sylvestris]
MNAPAQGILLSASFDLSLLVYSDSDWAACAVSRRFVTRFYITLGGSPISWKSKKQPIVSLSSVEAEYRALRMVVTEVFWLTRLLGDLGLPISALVSIFCNSQAALHIDKNPMFHERIKHIEVDCHYVRDGLHSGLISLQFVPSSAHHADMLTKPLHAFAFRNNQTFATCNPLPLLNSVLHWSYHPENHTVDLAYRHRGVTDSDWVAWGLNINGARMVGAQCLVAFKNSSGQIQAYTAPIANYVTQLRQGSLSFNVPRIEAEFSNNEYIIFASLELPSGRTSFNQVWQNGQVSGQALQAHSQSGDNLRSFGSVDFATGQLGNDGGSRV